MNNFKQKYKFSPTFKIGSMLILIFSGIAIAGGFALFIFGISWVFMGVYSGETVSDNHVTWGITMMVLGMYVMLMNIFALTLTSLAVNRKNPNNMMITAIVSIAGVVAMFGGVILLFTPVATKEENGKRVINPEQKVPTVIKHHASEKEFSQNNHELENLEKQELEKQKLKEELIALKQKITDNLADENEKNLFVVKTREYQDKYSK
ncbi:hypothetical protein ESOMN_v1c06070 [Williamsoniiplasma somnilux]|uniref:Uncharacterized protein n=1 Tax=Williamsoniiplasma somnilux TaxID=215578 RepID=A0A2K8NYU6_9MOLU|nr:tetraspanin family protein [Williamsoniiplasma somnilux]ATZ18989.1 hypothetical protein ESOMN_v1c06070 [Williamsoniiplasma somnilux]